LTAQQSDTIVVSTDPEQEGSANPNGYLGSVANGTLGDDDLVMLQKGMK
jgi:hypothetical protein